MKWPWRMFVRASYTADISLLMAMMLKFSSLVFTVLSTYRTAISNSLENVCF